MRIPASARPWPPWQLRSATVASAAVAAPPCVCSGTNGARLTWPRYGQQLNTLILLGATISPSPAHLTSDSRARALLLHLSLAPSATRFCLPSLLECSGKFSADPSASRHNACDHDLLVPRGLPIDLERLNYSPWQLVRFVRRPPACTLPSRKLC